MYQKLNKGKLPFTTLLIGLILSAGIVYFAIPKSWEDATKTNPDGSVSLSDEWEGAITGKREQAYKQELYKLVASQNMYAKCELCLGGKFFLYQNETYKYGTTALGKEGRGYNDQWRQENLLEYIHIMDGDLATIRAEQARLIGAYSILPENMRRPRQGESRAKPYWYRLVLPPGNKNLD